MAAASYGTDMTLINAADAANANWTEPTGFTDGAITLPETDYFIQGTGCLSKTMGAAATAASGAIFNNGAGVSIPGSNVVGMWLYFGAPNALATQANGGMRVFVGSATSAFRQWYVKGSDTYTYGGWFHVCVDPNTTPNLTTGAPTGVFQFFGAAAVLSGAGAVSRGNPLGIDFVRYGRGISRVSGGDLANGYATFAGLANATGNAIATRSGLFYSVAGGYLWMGLLDLGSQAIVDFRDSNVSIQVADNIKVQSDFNSIEIQNASSRVDWTGVNITALGTVSRGRLLMINNATVNLDTCVFTDMDIFNFLSNATVIDTTFRRCNLVTLGGATMTGCTFDKSFNPISLTCGSSISTISNCSFISDGNNHAIEITGGTSHTLNGLSFTGYAAGSVGSPVTTTSTGNEMVFVNIASGTVTLNSDTPLSVRSAGATVNVVAGQKTLTLTKLVTGSDIVITTSDTNTERVNVDSHGATTYAYSYTYAAGTFVDIRVFKEGYVPYVVYDFELPNADTPLPIAQVVDRNFQ